MKNTKKIILSVVAVLALAFYVVYQRFGFGHWPIAQPAPVIQNQSNSSQTPTQTGGSMMGNTGGSAGGTMMNNKPPMMGRYRDGEYTGISADAYYGNVQVVATISGGRITDVKFLDFPKDRRTSQEISAQAMPLLTNEAIVTQNANVDIISGATQTSEAFRVSLASALGQAK